MKKTALERVFLFEREFNQLEQENVSRWVLDPSRIKTTQLGGNNMATKREILAFIKSERERYSNLMNEGNSYFSDEHLENIRQRILTLDVIANRFDEDFWRLGESNRKKK